MIGGFHDVIVYDDGTQPGDIIVTVSGPPPINDPDRRIYRGLDPSLHPQDRVESVVFDPPGTYPVICAVSPAFC